MLNNLKHALPLIAGALASKQGVKVLQGDWAKTNCEDTIWLPALPEGDPNVKAKALGFVGHETAHISFTDTGLWPEIKQQKNPDTFFGTMNLLEDIRIEILQKRRFPGVSSNLDELFRILVEEGVYASSKEDDHPNKIMHNWMINKLRLEVLNQQAFETIADETEQVFIKTVPKNTQIRLEALAFDVVNATSTRDVFNLTREIIKMLEEEAEKEKEKEEEQAQQQQQTQQSNSNQSPDSSQSQSGDTSDVQGDSADSNGANSAGQDDGDAGDTAGNAKSNQPGSDQGQKMSEILQNILGAGQGDQYQDIGDVLAKQINDIKVKSAQTATDSSGPLRVFNANKQMSKGRNAGYDFKAKRAVNALKLKLHTMLQAQTMSSYTRSDQGSRFSKRHLHEIKVGGKVFEKRTEGIDIDIATAILIDISGSMNGSKLETAALAGYATAEALASINGVSSAVAVFPTKTGVDYISAFGSKPVINAENFNSLSVQGDTPLSDAMSRVSIDLLQQPQTRKVLLVITDGAPNHSDQSSVVIKAAQNAGVEIMGVGIGVDLDHLFDSWCSIDTVEDLPKALFGVLQNKLSFKQAA